MTNLGHLSADIAVTVTWAFRILLICMPANQMDGDSVSDSASRSPRDRLAARKIPPWFLSPGLFWVSSPSPQDIQSLTGTWSS